VLSRLEKRKGCSYSIDLHYLHWFSVDKCNHMFRNCYLSNIWLVLLVHANSIGFLSPQLIALFIYFKIFYIMNKILKNGRSKNWWVTRTYSSPEKTKNDRCIHVIADSTASHLYLRFVDITSILKFKKLPWFIKSLIIL